MNVNTNVTPSQRTALGRFVTQASSALVKAGSALGALALVFATPSCSGSTASGKFDGDLYVRACSLGCTNGLGGEQVFCTIVNTFLNQEIAILFSEPVDISTVNSSSFRVLNVANGTTPVGQFFSDPLDARRLIFRPALTFDENGNPSFGFDPNTAYEITIPGVAQGDNPPFIRSTSGRENLSRMKCTIETSDQLIDPVPGPPIVEIYMDRIVGGDPDNVDRVTAGSGNFFFFDGFGTDGLANNQINSGGPELVDAWRNSQVWFRFRDIMNPSTLASPSTMTAPFITVSVDEDGNLITSQDRNTLAGEYVASVDSENLITLLSFTPAQPLVSAGAANPSSPRRIVVNAPDSIIDLVGNRLEVEGGGGAWGVVPEVVEFDAITLNEDFSTPGGTAPIYTEDRAESGAVWGSGRLVRGFGGGSGRLGVLYVKQGDQIILNTDSQDFPLLTQGGSAVPDFIGNADMMGDFPSAITVTDGVFEFNSVVIEAGGLLRFEGDNPARLYVRGPVDIMPGGVIDLNGVTPAPHDSRILAPSVAGGTATLPAGAGAGGFGGDRWSATAALIGLADAESDAQANPDFMSFTGSVGEGVGGAAGRGRGGAGNPPTEAQWPDNSANINNSTDVARLPNVNLFIPPSEITTWCVATRVAGSGSGGAYAINGLGGVGRSPQSLADFPAAANNDAPDTTGGQASEIALATPSEDNTGYLKRTLDWFVNTSISYPGFLNGGSGGGGGGSHYYRTLASSQLNCDFLATSLGAYIEWHDHSGAQGGSGGGALLLVSGKTIDVSGQIQARGGNGGSSLQSGDTLNFGRYAMPGGGGSGGSVKLQSVQVSLGTDPGRLDVSGGAGGSNAFFGSNALGGGGSQGLIRIEDTVGTQTHVDYVQSILPFDSMGDPLSLAHLSVDEGGWQLPRQRPGSITASTSCWIRPEGNYFSLNFTEDGDPMAADVGWDMDVIWQPVMANPEVLVPFRSASAEFPQGFEFEYGNYYGFDSVMSGTEASPIVVRFQGARTSDDLLGNELCDVALSGPSAQILAGSLTPWVDHPALLNDFSPKPNMVRFMILFDGTVAGTDDPGITLFSSIKGVTNLRVSAMPD
ncbi:MAG: hypothetical protein ACI8QC_003557 [Planctomycetota bacterium]|jgi:hypothetical protein